MSDRKKQMGYSLVELIVVIAILSIVAGAGYSMLGLLSGKYAKECATRTQSALSDIKIEAMSKSKGATNYDVYIRLYVKGDGIYIESANVATVGSEIHETTKIGKSAKVTVTAVKGTLGTAGGDSVNLADLGDTGITIAFDRSDGSFCPVRGETDIYWKQLIFKQGSVTYQLDLIPRTGKFSLSKM